MKILVTGGLGFIGSNFIRNMLKNHPDFFIINLDAEVYGSNHMNLEGIDHKRYKFVRGNICNQKIVNQLVKKCEIVINFAAESHVDRSISNSKPFIETNIVGVSNILEAIKNEKKQFIQISTDEIFGSLNKNSAKEEDKLNPSSPYASSKASAELLVRSYITTYQSNCIITRCTNNYGPRQFPEKLIPKTILLAHQNKNIPIYGTGKNVRDWIFVDDHCDAIFNIIENGKSGESYNIGADNEIDNITIVKKILKIMDKPIDLIEFVEDRPGHDLRYSLDSTKIKNQLQWKNRTIFENGLKETVEWYIENMEWVEKLSKNILSSTPWKNKFMI